MLNQHYYTSHTLNLCTVFDFHHSILEGSASLLKVFMLSVAAVVQSKYPQQVDTFPQETQFHNR